MMNITIELVEKELIYPLRHKVLRSGRPFETCFFEGDEQDSTYHFAAFENDVVIGVASLMRVKIDLFDASTVGYQLRGMAVDPAYRGKQIGGRLLTEIEKQLKHDNIHYLWFNARTSAVEFYLKMGYVKQGGEFQIPEVGPHFKMYKQL